METAHGGILQRSQDALQAPGSGDWFIRTERARVDATGDQFYHLCGARLHRTTLGVLLPETGIFEHG